MSGIIPLPPRDPFNVKYIVAHKIIYSPIENCVQPIDDDDKGRIFNGSWSAAQHSHQREALLVP